MTKSQKIYVVKYSYSDQYSQETSIIGVFDNLKAAKVCRANGDGYYSIYEAEMNVEFPDQMKLVK